jgi:L-seryl-tRNA(Ser) seleniumtransferase
MATSSGQRSGFYMNSPRIHLPAIDRLLKHEDAATLLAQHGHTPVVESLRAATAAYRAALLGGATPAEDAEAMLLATASEALAASQQRSLRPVFNLSGTVLHTNLGRALLAESAVAALASAASQPSNLEYELASAQRGHRDAHVEHWLTRITGAEAATAVNNCAAAVMLILNTFAPRKEVIVARGELVEIGGAFRIPDVMATAGARLREVGTTNRVHLRDYAEAISPRTAMIMKIHPSNYRIEGFTASVPEADLATLAHQHGLPLAVDLGSGTLLDFAAFGLPHEPTVQETLAQGADLVAFSGDKLLGGPQAGLIVGRKDLIQRLRKNPMTRALRLDKLIIAALEATLRLYGDAEHARRQIPTLRLLTRPESEIAALAHRLQPTVAAACADCATVSVQACASQIGSGALPVDLLPSAALVLTPRAEWKVDALAARLRALPRPVIGRIYQDALWLDLRCLEDEAGFIGQLQRLAAGA